MHLLIMEWERADRVHPSGLKPEAANSGLGVSHQTI
jgi:hypothetical protein